MDKLILGLLIVVLLLLIVLIVLLIKNGKNQKSIDFYDTIENDINGNIKSEFLVFNEYFTKSLTNISAQNSENMGNLKNNLTRDLGEFQTKMNEKINKEFISLNETFEKRMNLINEKVDERLNKGFETTNKTFTDIVKTMTAIGEAQKKIEGLSTEVVGLQNILTNNQTRGSFGEFQLNQMLSSAFSNYKDIYETQYTIKESSDGSAVRVDAVIHMPEPYYLLCIDSKFPFSSYSKLIEGDVSNEEEKKLLSSFAAEVKKHITDISKKYIISGKTADYAVMFVPSDGILTLLHSKCFNVVEYAQEKKVVIVSPTTLYPLLRSILQIRIDYDKSKYAKYIGEQLDKLGKDFKGFAKEWEKLSKSIGSLGAQHELIDRRVVRISGKFDNLTHGSIEENDDFDDE